MENGSNSLAVLSQVSSFVSLGPVIPPLAQVCRRCPPLHDVTDPRPLSGPLLKRMRDDFLLGSPLQVRVVVGNHDENQPMKAVCSRPNVRPWTRAVK